MSTNKIMVQVNRKEICCLQMTIYLFIYTFAVQKEMVFSCLFEQNSKATIPIAIIVTWAVLRGLWRIIPISDYILYYFLWLVFIHIYIYQSPRFILSDFLWAKKKSYLFMIQSIKQITHSSLSKIVSQCQCMFKRKINLKR